MLILFWLAFSLSTPTISCMDEIITSAFLFIGKYDLNVLSTINLSINELSAVSLSSKNSLGKHLSFFFSAFRNKSMFCYFVTTSRDQNQLSAVMFQFEPYIDFAIRKIDYVGTSFFFSLADNNPLESLTI